MRQIKFRFWNKETNLMEMPNEGSYAQMGQSENDECVIMQYTGLKDKNGKEIYEGDIIIKDCYLWMEHGKPNYRGTVEWIFSQWQVVAHCVNPNKRGISDGINEGINDDGVDEGEKTEWIILGNIYENPNLLNQNPTSK